MTIKNNSDSMHMLRQTVKLVHCPACGAKVVSCGFAAHRRSCERKNERRRPRT